MAELLVMKRDGGHGYLRGHVVAVKHDNFGWGEGDRRDPFMLVRVPGINEHAFDFLLQPGALLPRAVRIDPDLLAPQMTEAQVRGAVIELRERIAAA